MGRLLVVACLGFAACQSMYGGPADPLRTPAVHPHKAVPDPDPQVAYVEDCTVDFQRDPHRVRREVDASRTAVSDADTALANAQRAPSDAARVDLVRDAVRSYGRALEKDPYNPEATLKLALAYDRVLRKGCALALLRRLHALADNPRLATAAGPKIDELVDNPQWFKPYRSDAMKAVGR